MKRIIVFSYIILMQLALPSLYANECIEKNADIDIYEIKRYLSKEDLHPINLGWLIDRYDFDQIEEYLSYQYDAYYKYYEQYVANKQHEIAGKFGLSSIYFRPSIKQYDNTKLILTRKVWDNKVTLRYLAPLRDMGDFEIMMKLRPTQYFNLILKSEINGESSVSIAITFPLGKASKEKDTGKLMKNTLRKVMGGKITYQTFK